MLSTTALVTIGVSALLIGAGGAGILRLKSEPPKADKPATANDPYVLGYKLKDIDGKDQDLAQYKGKVILMVNVASKCGYTKQYAGLEALYQARKEQGFVILGFPANNFGSQEPGSNQEIKQFCTSNYGVTFPMFEKISVKGDDRHALYAKLSDLKGEPKWNFTKYLVGKDGNVIAKFDSGVKPDDKQLAQQIDEALAAK